MSAERSQDELDRSRAETRAAFNNRALIYLYIFQEIAEAVGEDRAAEIMKRAIRRRGVEVGAKFRDAAQAGDLDEVARIFCEDSPCEGALFTPGVEERLADGIVLRMTSCPLVDAWETAGASPETIDLLCEIAAAVDYGTFEGAGLDLRFLDRKGIPGSDRCLLQLNLRR